MHIYIYIYTHTYTPACCRIKMPRMRQAIAKNLKNAQDTQAAHYCLKYGLNNVYTRYGD